LSRVLFHAIGSYNLKFNIKNINANLIHEQGLYFGNNPEIWEIGLFSDHPEVAGAGLLVAYGTFPVEIKDNTKQIVNNVRIVWGV
jgi:hypothetical protein